MPHQRPGQAWGNIPSRSRPATYLSRARRREQRWGRPQSTVPGWWGRGRQDFHPRPRRVEPARAAQGGETDVPGPPRLSVRLRSRSPGHRFRRGARALVRRRSGHRKPRPRRGVRTWHALCGRSRRCARTRRRRSWNGSGGRPRTATPPPSCAWLALLLLEGRGGREATRYEGDRGPGPGCGGEWTARGHVPSGPQAYRYGHGVAANRQRGRGRNLAPQGGGSRPRRGHGRPRSPPGDRPPARLCLRRRPAAPGGRPGQWRRSAGARPTLPFRATGVPQRSVPGQAAIWFRAKAADQGVVGAEFRGRSEPCMPTGLALEQGPDDRSRRLAAPWRGRAGRPRSRSLYNIGTLHAAGLGTERDTDAAIRWYREAAEHGNAEACLRLGVIYAVGDGVGQDYTAAAEWYGQGPPTWVTWRRDGTSHSLHLRGCGVATNAQVTVWSLLKSASDAGSQSAAWAPVQPAYRRTASVPADPEAAAAFWLERVARRWGGGIACACRLASWRTWKPAMSASPASVCFRCCPRSRRQENPMPRRVLGGSICEWQADLPRDPRGRARAVSWPPPNSGHAHAQAWLGDVLLTGQDVIPDRPAALHWYRKAAEQGHVGAPSGSVHRELETGGSETRHSPAFSLWLETPRRPATPRRAGSWVTTTRGERGSKDRFRKRLSGCDWPSRTAPQAPGWSSLRSC